MKRDLWFIVVLFSANLLVPGPWLLTDFSAQPWNNGYIYIAIAKMFRDLPWGWNPLQYGGAPFHYLYPPFFHVMVGALPVKSLGLAFHLVTGIGYALVPVALYILGLKLFEGRLLASFAAIVYSFFPSPAYAMAQWRGLALPYFHAPWGFVTLVAYEEAAHTFALPFTLLAIAAAWSERWLLATLLAALVLLTNWPGLIGMGLFLAALAVVKPIRWVVTLAGTAYGLSAFWMTPGYFVSSSLLNRVVLRHTISAAPFNGTTWGVLCGAAILLALSFWPRVPARVRFLLALVALTGAVIVSFTLAGNYLLPSPHRYMLEFNAALVLALAGLISLAPVKWRQAAIAVVLLAGAIPAYAFLSHAWSVQPGPEDPHNGVAFQAAEWFNHAGASRVFVSGELDSTLPLWSAVPQVGGSGQDVSNFLVFAAERQVAYGCEAESERITELWLRALHVQYMLVHSAASAEYFHWFAQPDKFRVLPVVWDSGAGDTVYRAPEFDPREAVVVDLPELGRLPPIESTRDTRFLEAYVRWAAGKRGAAIHWNNSGSAMIDASLAPDEAVLVKINHDPNWHVSHGVGSRDPIGFLLIKGQENGQKDVELQFGPSWEVWLGRLITGFTILALVFARGPRLWIAALAVIPALAAYGFLMVSVPSTTAVAEEAFVRLQPPIINPGGIVRSGKLIAVYGLNFGKPADTVRVRVGGRPAELKYHGPNLITFEMPEPAPPRPPVSVEVNGCRGNEFLIPAQ